MPNIDTSQMLPKGTMLHDNAYRIDSYLASGGFGNTYLASNIAFDEKVAIKEFFLRGQSERTDDMLSVRVTRGQELFFDEQKRKFVKEAQRIRRLRNPHIVRVHDLFEANGTAYYVMDYIDGESVAARIKRTGKPFSEEETRNLLTQVLDALTEVHEAGIYHLDIKPDNILLDRKGNAYLIDFGASKVQSQSGDGVNCTSAFSATPEYAPLELTDGNIQNIGAWTDIYSIGATAYRMLTGVVPPRSSEVVIRGSEAFRFTDAVSQSMQKFISTCMAGDYRKRPQTAAATIDLLNAKPQLVVQPKPQVVEHPKPQVVEQPKPQPIPAPQPLRDSDATKVIGEKQNKIKLSEQKKSDKDSNNGSSVTKGLGCIFIVILGAIIYLAISKSSDNRFKEAAPEDSCAIEAVPDVEKETFTVNGVDFTMIRVEAGTFQMGSNSEYDNEKPIHQVTLTKDYYIGETEVTQALWQAVMGTTVRNQRDKANPGGSLRGEGANYPMYYVNYEECEQFIRKLNSLTGKNFRLPTEAEWEYAAKGGNKSKGYTYSGSKYLDDDVAWYYENSEGCTHPVKTKAANELGIYDMSGNVGEWCYDWYGDYISSAQTDPTGATSGSLRVLRGGSWYNFATGCSSAFRYRYTPTYRSDYNGVRLAL